ncbi:MAG: EAL domain-containing protein [Betaproteobacteria bacterium]
MMLLLGTMSGRRGVAAFLNLSQRFAARGFSGSLASLHQLPIDIVKIDRSFVCQAGPSNHHRVLIEATIRVAGSLGMSTVAEGIETETQASVLRQLDCEKGQFIQQTPVARGSCAVADSCSAACKLIAAPTGRGLGEIRERDTAGVNRDAP